MDDQACLANLFPTDSTFLIGENQTGKVCGLNVINVSNGNTEVAMARGQFNVTKVKHSAEGMGCGWLGVFARMVEVEEVM